MYRIAIGVDIGIASVGWAVLALDENNNPCGIIDMGTRIFKRNSDSKSLAEPRREARGMRRVIRRKHHRKERIRALIINHGLLSKEQMDGLFNGRLEDIYVLRVRALDERVSREEFARIMLHLAQRRGFRSNRKGEVDDEDGKLLKAIGENEGIIKDGHYRTAGEMFLNDSRFKERKRNKNDYICTITRDMVESEARLIFAAQRGFGADYATQELENAYLEILLSQRSFDEGPGGNSPYGGNQIEKMIGKCTLEPNEPRAPKASYSFEYFNLLEKVNHIRLLDGGESIPLSDAQRKAVIALAHKPGTLTYDKLRKELGLGENVRFNMVRYTAEATVEEQEKKEKLNFLKAYHQMRQAVEKAGKGRFALITVQQRNEIARILTTYKTAENINKALTEAGLEQADIAELEKLNFSKTGHLSVVACDKIIPFLEKGMNYSEACTAAGYDFRAHNKADRNKYLPPLDEESQDIKSPIARRAVTQTIKVINAIIKRYGQSPVYVNVELARDLALSYAAREEAEKENNKNKKARENSAKDIKDYNGGREPSGLDIEKYLLWKEQDGICPYSQKRISIEKLFDPHCHGYAEVDHIVPYSRSFDNSRTNKVLVLTEENRNKGNRLPLEYLNDERREAYIVWVNANIRDAKKRMLLLKESFSKDDSNKKISENLEDTGYASRFMYNYINDNLEFAPSTMKKKVRAVSGRATGRMRAKWGIKKVREDGDLHHAVDAVVIACINESMIRSVTDYENGRESRYMPERNKSIIVDPTTGEVKERFPEPWPWFRKELEARLANDPSREIANLKLPFYMDEDAPRVKPLFVSRVVDHKITGQLHDATIYSYRTLNDTDKSNFYISKTPLTKLKYENGEILNYYNKESDLLLYNALKARLEAYGGDAKKAFAEPFYKPKKDGTPGPLVKSVKTGTKMTKPVAVHKDKETGAVTGVAKADSMVRIDVFKVEGDGYYFVPIYALDTVKAELPNRAAVPHKPYDAWKTMSDDNFVFFLYKNDLISVKHQNTIVLRKTIKGGTLPEMVEKREGMFYYNSADIEGGKIGFESIDGAYCGRLGIKTLESIEKYTVDVLGEYHPVRKEERQRFNKKKG